MRRTSAKCSASSRRLMGAFTYQENNAHAVSWEKGTPRKDSRSSEMELALGPMPHNERASSVAREDRLFASIISRTEYRNPMRSLMACCMSAMLEEISVIAAVYWLVAPATPVMPLMYSWITGALTDTGTPQVFVGVLT